MGAALPALLSTVSPLRSLCLCNCDLGDEGVTALCAALPRAALRSLLDAASNGITAHCARHVLLPSVTANASLRSLHLSYCTEEGEDSRPWLMQAEAEVLGRTASADG